MSTEKLQQLLTPSGQVGNFFSNCVAQISKMQNEKKALNLGLF